MQTREIGLHEECEQQRLLVTLRSTKYRIHDLLTLFVVEVQEANFSEFDQNWADLVPAFFKGAEGPCCRFKALLREYKILEVFELEIAETFLYEIRKYGQLLLTFRQQTKSL